MKNRKKQRANRKLKYADSNLSKYSFCGYKDLTPYNAIRKIQTNDQATIALK